MLAVVLGTLVVGGVAGAASKSAGVNATAVGRLAIDWPHFDFQANQISPVAASLPGYDRLVAWGLGPKIVPYLATSWVVTPALRPKSVTFTLRKDAKCGDGTPVTPLVVLNSFQRLITVPKTVPQMLAAFGPGPYSVSASVKKNTFTFRTQTPHGNLLAGFALYISGIVCPAGLRALASDPHALENQQYGSGPYNVVSATHGNEIVYSLRSNWKWGPGGTTAADLPTTLIYRVVADETTTANLLLTGGVNFTINPLLGIDTQRLNATKSLYHQSSPNYEVYQFVFDQLPGHPAANDKAFRQALSTAVDPKAYNQAAFQGTGIVAPSIQPPIPGCSMKSAANLIPTPSIARAKQILEAGGWSQTNGGWVKNGQPLGTLRMTAGAFNGAGGEYIVGQLKQLGINVNLVQNNSSYANDITTGNWDIGIHSVDSPMPLLGLPLRSFVGNISSKGGANLGNYGASNPTYLRLGRIATQFAGVKGCSLLEQFNRTAIQNAEWLPLAAPISHMYGNGWTFKGALPSPAFEYLWLRRAK